MRAPDDDRDELPPAEAARDRRRDRHASAAERAGMRTGLAKQFKQVLDAQARRAREAVAPAPDEDVDDEAEAAERRRQPPGDHHHRERHAPREP